MVAYMSASGCTHYYSTRKSSPSLSQHAGAYAEPRASGPEVRRTELRVLNILEGFETDEKPHASIVRKIMADKSESSLRNADSNTEAYVRTPGRQDSVGRLHRLIEQSGVRMIERHYPSGSTIFSLGSAAESLYLVSSGTVRLYRLYNGFTEATTALVGEGEIFGESSLGVDSSQQDFAEARTDSYIATVSKHQLAGSVSRDPELATSLLELMMERIDVSQGVMDGLFYRQVPNRLATLLINLMERFGRVDRNGDQHLQMTLSHRELAEMIASSREAVSHAMKDLSQGGLIEYQRGQIRVEDYHALCDIASGERFKPRAIQVGK